MKNSMKFPPRIPTRTAIWTVIPFLGIISKGNKVTLIDELMYSLQHYSQRPSPSISGWMDKENVGGVWCVVDQKKNAQCKSCELSLLRTVAWETWKGFWGTVLKRWEKASLYMTLYIYIYDFFFLLENILSQVCIFVENCH